MALRTPGASEGPGEAPGAVPVGSGRGLTTTWRNDVGFTPCQTLGPADRLC